MISNGTFTRVECGVVPLVVVTFLLTMPGLAVADGLGLEQRGSVLLEPCPIAEVGGEMLCGSYEVFENRGAQAGRRISLNIAVLPALGSNAQPDPVFYLVGGPGGAATRRAPSLSTSWMRNDRDIVLVDQRGTGLSNPLPCDEPGSPEDLQGYLAPPFSDIEAYRRCRAQLAGVADLTQYHSSVAMDDLDEVRSAMGYKTINLYGGSWGSRFALIYLRRHGAHVRTAILNAVAPTALIYGLEHAAGAQSSFELLIRECARDARCSSKFADLEREFGIVLQRLKRTPVTVVIEHPDTGVAVSVRFERAAYVEVIRYLLNSVDNTRYLPHLIHQAYQGTFEPLAQLAVEKNHFYRNALKTGMLLSVVCPGDVARINPDDIPRLTNNTFMGDRRVRDTMAVCDIWPQPRLPSSYGDPVPSDVPILLWSGTLDPSNPPRWGEEAARHLPNGLHLVVPGSHVVGGACIDQVSSEFLAQSSVESLDTSCLRGIRLPPFYLPGGG